MVFAEHRFSAVLANGRRCVNDYCFAYEVRDGQVRQIREYMDTRGGWARSSAPARLQQYLLSPNAEAGDAALRPAIDKRFLGAFQELRLGRLGCGGGAAGNAWSYTSLKRSISASRLSALPGKPQCSANPGASLNVSNMRSQTVRSPKLYLRAPSWWWTVWCLGRWRNQPSHCGVWMLEWSKYSPPRRRTMSTRGRALNRQTRSRSGSRRGWSLGCCQLRGH